MNKILLSEYKDLLPTIRDNSIDLVCEQLNRQYIISDNNEDYLSITKERIKKEQMQKRMF